MTHDGKARLPVLQFDDAEATSCGGGDLKPLPKKRLRRAYTINIKRLAKRDLERGWIEYPVEVYRRPKTRADCTEGFNVMRPCPFVSCKYHLFLDVNERNGSITLNFGRDSEVDHLRDTCALDVADRGEHTHEDTAATLGLTGSRVQQLEHRLLARLRLLADLGKLTDWIDAERVLHDAHARRGGEAHGDELVVFEVSGGGREALSGLELVWDDHLRP